VKIKQENEEMPAEKIRRTVTELESELGVLESIDDETRQILLNALDEILAALAKDGPQVRDESLIDRLKHSAEKFEDAHPSVTRLISGLVDGLGQMGI
jgi:hypothetical protein